MNEAIGTDSEIGRLRTALVHRPGPELRRVTPRTRARLGFDCLPWLARAQQEHDALTDVLRERGTEVLYVTELLQDVLEYAEAREEAIASVLAGAELGAELGAVVAGHLSSLPPQDLARTLICGLTPGELRSGHGLVYDLLGQHDFVIEPLPGLVFSRDCGVWAGDQVVLASLPGPRRREADLMAVVYGHHPRFAGTACHRLPAGSRFDGGDVILLAPGVLAVGVGLRTSPASAELLAGILLGAGVVRTVLALPMGQAGPGDRLDQVCTVVGTGVVLMSPGRAFTQTALAVAGDGKSLKVSRPRPFLEAAAAAIGVDSLTVIGTSLDSPAGAGDWDDGCNTLAIGDATALCSERNGHTNARLAAAGFEVLTVPAGELSPMRGGPRSMCSAIRRDPPVRPEEAPGQRADQPGAQGSLPRRDPAVLAGSGVPGSPGEAAREPGQLAPVR